MRARTYQNKADKEAGTFHVQIAMDMNEAKALAAGEKEIIAELKSETKKLVK